jgi:hypothetical protein
VRPFVHHIRGSVNGAVNIGKLAEATVAIGLPLMFEVVITVRPSLPGSTPDNEELDVAGLFAQRVLRIAVGFHSDRASGTFNGYIRELSRSGEALR